VTSSGCKLGVLRAGNIRRVNNERRGIDKASSACAVVKPDLCDLAVMERTMGARNLRVRSGQIRMRNINIIRVCRRVPSLLHQYFVPLSVRISKYVRMLFPLLARASDKS
jgi:hypothetical protein